MVRGIKFRTWDKLNNEMTTSNKLLDVLVSMDNKLFAMVKGQNETLGGIKRESTTIMQYTGREDRNGKEIYECDIVKQFPKDGYEHITMGGDLGIVDFAVGSYIIRNANDGRTHFFFYTEQEVVGNIFENPELLEESK